MTQRPEWSTVPDPGSRVLVTGAAGGLGRALSAALTEVGAEVVGTEPDRRL
jgi:3-oxoacyl-[acyl-carrier protein] reductase